MYLKDKLIVAIIDILYSVIIILATIESWINPITAVVLIILIGIITRLYMEIKEDKYKRDMHDNLENIAKKQQ